MKQLVSVSSVLLYTAVCHVLALDLSNSSRLILPSRISNASTLSVPSEFSIEFSTTRDFGPPMDEIAIYMNAIAAMEDLCFRDQSAYMPGHPRDTWSLSQHDLYIEISSQQVRFAIWGLQLTAGAVRKAEFWPIVGRVYWREEFAGRVDIANSDYPLDDIDLAKGKQRIGAIPSNTTGRSGPSGIFVNSSTAVDLLDSASLSIVPRYSGASISARSVFGTAINVMVHGAESGPNTYCLHLQRPEVEIVTEYDEGGNPLLKYKHLIRAMRMLTTWMVGMDRFGEIDVDIWRGGVVIGRARIKKRVRALT